MAKLFIITDDQCVNNGVKYSEGINSSPGKLQVFNWEKFDDVIAESGISATYIWDVEILEDYIPYTDNLVITCNKIRLSNKRMACDDEDICLRILKNDPWFIQYIDNPTEEMCLTAVRANGFTLKYIKKQTEEMCLEAVKQYGVVLRDVLVQTKKIIAAALKQNPKAIEHIQEPFKSIFANLIIKYCKKNVSK